MECRLCGRRAFGAGEERLGCEKEEALGRIVRRNSSREPWRFYPFFSFGIWNECALVCGRECQWQCVLRARYIEKERYGNSCVDEAVFITWHHKPLRQSLRASHDPQFNSQTPFFFFSAAYKTRQTKRFLMDSYFAVAMRLS